MSSSSPIGGYFELEYGGTDAGFMHADALMLNSGRACFEYVLRTSGASHVHLPKYMCDAMIEPLANLGVGYSFYAIDAALEIASPIDPGDGEYLVYANYFGIKDDYCRRLAARFGRRLILDCSQALYFDPPAGAQSFYSPRKFLGVPDGGCLYADGRLGAELATDSSEGRYRHLVGRIDRGAEQAYAAFKESEASLDGQPIKHMSPSTRRLLGTIDHGRVRRIRAENFAFLHARLGARNGLALPAERNACPMVYPYLTEDPGLRAKLIERKIFVASYWPNVLSWCEPGDLEFALAVRLLPLPIDQRYGPAEMDRIVRAIET